MQGTFMNKLRTFGTTLVTQRDKVYKQWREALDAIHLLDELKAEACTKRSRAQLAARINNAPKRGEEIKKLVDALGLALKYTDVLMTLRGRQQDMVREMLTLQQKREWPKNEKRLTFVMNLNNKK